MLFREKPTQALEADNPNFVPLQLWDGTDFTMEMLRCEGLSKSFEGTHALAEASVEFPSSGVVAIIGPNGAGKTTLLKERTGFLRAESGRFFLDGKELTRMAPHKRVKPWSISR